VKECENQLNDLLSTSLMPNETRQKRNYTYQKYHLGIYLLKIHDCLFKINSKRVDPFAFRINPPLRSKYSYLT
jgi:hypothetical protein